MIEGLKFEIKTSVLAEHLRAFATYWARESQRAIAIIEMSSRGKTKEQIERARERAKTPATQAERWARLADMLPENETLRLTLKELGEVGYPAEEFPHCSDEELEKNLYADSMSDLAERFVRHLSGPTTSASPRTLS
jgi:hypothetical protein